ncbi:uncharacterized [Tachysurus ichikawai]
MGKDGGDFIVDLIYVVDFQLQKPLLVTASDEMLREILQPDSHPRIQAGFVVEAETAAPSAPVASLAYNDCLFRK